MSLKQVKEQIVAMRNEIGRQGGREWITIKVPADANDEAITTWLDDAIGCDWRRHVFVRLECQEISVPIIVGRVAASETPGFDRLTFNASEAALV